MRGFTALAPAVLALALGACDSIQGAQMPSTTTADTIKTINAYYKDLGASPKNSRDKVIDTRLALSNANFRAFTIELREAKVGVNLGSEFIALVLSAVGAVTGGAATKGILAAATTAVLGSAASYDKHVFYQKTVTAIIAQMSAERDTIIAAIQRERAKDVEQYPLGAAIDHLDRLDQAGSVEVALSRITEKATKDAKDANAEVLNISPERSAADSEYLISAAGRAHRDRVGKMVAAVPFPKVAEIALKPSGIDNAKADGAAQQRIKDLGTLNADSARIVIHIRLAAVKGKAELEKWEALLKP